MTVNVDLYVENGLHCAWISCDGDSGIEVEAETYEEFAKEIGAYLADYSFNEEEDDCEE